MWQLPRLLNIFPCAHFVHALRDPRDLAAKPEEHAYRRIEVQMKTIALALGFNGSSTREAAAFLCTHKKTRASGNSSGALCTQYMLEGMPEGGVPKGTCCGVTTPEFDLRTQREPKLQRAMQCATLLGWLGNSFLQKWADATLPSSAYVPYQIELSGDPQLAQLQRDALRTRTLGIQASVSGAARRELLEKPKLSNTWQSRLGKWRRLVSPNRWIELQHCGRWKDAMEELFQTSEEAAVDAASSGEAAAVNERDTLAEEENHVRDTFLEARISEINEEQNKKRMLHAAAAPKPAQAPIAPTAAAAVKSPIMEKPSHLLVWIVVGFGGASAYMLLAVGVLLVGGVVL